MSMYTYVYFKRSSVSSLIAYLIYAKKIERNHISLLEVLINII